MPDLGDLRRRLAYETEPGVHTYHQCGREKRLGYLRSVTCASAARGECCAECLRREIAELERSER